MGSECCLQQRGRELLGTKIPCIHGGSKECEGDGREKFRAPGEELGWELWGIKARAEPGNMARLAPILELCDLEWLTPSLDLSISSE